MMRISSYPTNRPSFVSSSSCSISPLPPPPPPPRSKNDRMMPRSDSNVELDELDEGMTTMGTMLGMGGSSTSRSRRRSSSRKRRDGLGFGACSTSSLASYSRRTTKVSRSNDSRHYQPYQHRPNQPSNPSASSPTPHTSTSTLTLILLTVLSTYLPLTQATSTAPTSLPQIDFDRMGTVTLTGDFVGLGFYDENVSSSSTLSLGVGVEGDVLVSLGEGGGEMTDMVLGRTDEGGRIRSVCRLGGDYYVGGQFGSMRSLSSASSSAAGEVVVVEGLGGLGRFTPTSASSSDDGSGGPEGEWYKLGQSGVGTGTVNVVWCDETNEMVWIGGMFDGLSGDGGGQTTTGSNVLVYYPGNDTLSAPPFGGLDGSVYSITPSSASSSSGVYFGGDFTTSFDLTSNTTNSTNTTTTTLKSILDRYPSSAPDGTITTGFSRYLTPLSLTNASIDAGPSSGESGRGSVGAITCPEEGGDEVYYGRDASVVKITVRLFRELRAVGVRLGNTFGGDGSTTEFRVVTIPDNAQQTLIYTDTETGQNVTCSDACPLSTNSSILAQDFLFSGGIEGITGFQVYLEGWSGSAAGLSRLQLLSSGGTASAVEGDNYPVCGGGGGGGASSASNVEQTGSWNTRQVDTGISGTTQMVSVADVSNGQGDRPSTTWYPYITSSGNYSVYLNIPGCQRMGDCASRTEVDVGVFPYSGSLGYTSTVSQAVNEDTSELLYSGYMQASNSGAFQSTVRLALAANPSGTSSGTWQVVAGGISLDYTAAVTANGTRIPLVTGLNSTVSINSTEFGNETTESGSIRRAAGVYEWIRGDAQQEGIDATGLLGNDTITDLTNLGFALSNNASQNGEVAIRAIVSLDDIVYAAGAFVQEGNFSNVVAYKDGAASALARQGLNGTVNSALVDGQYVFFGGAFRATADGSTALSGLARYDPATDSWSSLAGGVDGPVTSLASGSNGDILVVGNFTNTLDMNGTSTMTGGYAVWSTRSESWTTRGLVMGRVSTVVSDGDRNLIAGRISGSSSVGANGIAYLSGNGENAQITPGSIGFASPSTSNPSNFVRKRSRFASSHNGHASRSWLNKFSDALRKRQSNGSASTSLPTVVADDPSVLTAAYWTNSSASGSPTITCVGGNFSLSQSQGVSLGFYDQETGTTTPVNGEQPVGVVRSLAVVDNTLIVAGNFDLDDQHSIASYNLASGSWNDGLPGLDNGTESGDVYAIRQRPNSRTLIAAGVFTSAGSLPCIGVCAWDLDASRWSSLGSGLARGQVRNIEFVENSLVIAGAFALSDGTSAYVARYDFASSTWTALGGVGTGEGQLEGPVTALALDDGDMNKVYAAGVSTSGDEPFIRRWNGQTWESQSPSPLAGSSISSMVVVPLATDFSQNDAMNSDRMLMVMGNLVLPDQGNSTVALYDGAQWYPYLTSVGRNGNSAGANGLFYSIHDFSFYTRHYLALGLIVLIALAISTGLIFLVVLLGLLIAFWWRRHRKAAPPPPVITTLMEKRPSSEFGGGRDGDTDSLRLRRLDAIQQAVFGSAAVAATSFAAANKAQSPRDTSRDDDARSSFGYDSTSQGHAGAQTTETHAGESTTPSHMGRPTTVKYNFEAEDPAELSVREGDRVNVLEEDESEQWWYVRDIEGREGVVPASYLW